MSVDQMTLMTSVKKKKLKVASKEKKVASKQIIFSNIINLTDVG